MSKGHTDLRTITLTLLILIYYMAQYIKHLIKLNLLERETRKEKTKECRPTQSMSRPQSHHHRSVSSAVGKGCTAACDYKGDQPKPGKVMITLMPTKKNKKPHYRPQSKTSAQFM